MKRNTLIASIVSIVIGFILARVGDSLSTVTESGMVQDSILMPIGALLMFLGFLALVVAVLWYIIDFFKGKAKKEKA